MRSTRRRHVGVEVGGVGGAEGAEGAGPRLVLGVDVGTSSVKAAVLDPSRSRAVPLANRARATRANVASREAPCHGREQDVGRIMEALEQCLLALPSRLLNRVGLVGVSGQMHGVVLWRSGQGWRYRPSKREAAADGDADAAAADSGQGGVGSWFDVAECSRLITWEDARCTPDFLSALPAPRPGACAAASGYGCATLLWLARHAPGALRDYDCAGTVQDLLVSALCDLPTPVMTAHNAASWGYFDAQAGAWDMEGLRLAGFPSRPPLPPLVPVGSVAGRTRSDLCGLPRGTEVGAALGDLQAAVYCCLERRTDAVLNIGTSAQLAYVLPPGLHPPPPSSSSLTADRPPPHAARDDSNAGGSSSPCSGGGGGGVVRDVFPYVGDRRLCVAASLNGGNVLAMFVDTLRSWIADLGLEPPAADDLYVTLNRLASAIEDEPEPPPDLPSDLTSRSGAPGKQETPTPDLSIRPGAPGKQQTPAPDPDPSIRPGAPGKQQTPAPDPDPSILPGAPGKQETPTPDPSIRPGAPGKQETPNPDPSIRPGAPGKQHTPAPDASIRPGAPPGKLEAPTPTTPAPVRAPAPAPAPRLTICPTVFGERGSPASRGLVSLSGVAAPGPRLGRVWRSLCRGLVENLAGPAVGRGEEGGGRPPLPPGVERVLAGGSALLRNSTLAREAAVALRVPTVEATGTVDSAVGSARLLWDASGRGGGRGGGGAGSGSS